MDRSTLSTATENASGIFEAGDRDGGHLRQPTGCFEPRPQDVWVTPELCKQWQLRGGEMVSGRAGQGGQRKGKNARGNGRQRLLEIADVDGRLLDDHLERTAFESLTAIEPRKQMCFATPGGPTTMRIVDLLTPIGFGQRGLIAAPPRTGKTVLLQQMADGAAANHPNLRLIVLLIDERPEEVTDMRRRVKGEVVASSNDKQIESHVRVARLVIARAKRLVEAGEDVLILLDSLTRLGRAFNAFIRQSGRIMSGGLDIRALEEPKSVFGAARNTEEGGSLTIVATSLIETGSRMDDVIFSEFKGTGNMEIMLSRALANMRVWPAIDLQASGTRKEELLLSPEALAASHAIRRSILGRDPVRSMEELLGMMDRCPENAALYKQFAPVATGPRRRLR